MSMGRGICVLLVAVGCLMLAGCGYSTNPLIRQDIKTVYVPVFENSTWPLRRGMEVALTRAVSEEIKLHTPLAIASRDDAHSTLEGELLEFEEDVVAKSETDEVLVVKATVAVEFRWVDNLTRRELVPRQTVRENVEFVASGSEPFETRVFQKVAERIVEEMQKDW